VFSLAAVICAICPPTNANLPSTSCARGAPILPSLPGRASFTTFHPLDFAAHPLHSPRPSQLFLSFNGPDHRLSCDPHGDRAYYLGPLSPTTAVTVSMSSPLALNAPPLTLHTFPSPSFTSPSLTYPQPFLPHLFQPVLPSPSMART
jgi:hypothetical protein